MFVTSAFAQESAPAAEGAHTGTEGDTHSGTGVPAEAHGTFPPFDPATFPSQLLWLAITFGLFYLFLKNVVMPRLGDQARHLDVDGNAEENNKGNSGPERCERCGVHDVLLSGPRI